MNQHKEFTGFCRAADLFVYCFNQRNVTAQDINKIQLLSQPGLAKQLPFVYRY
jgi:hypothetical protein